VFDNAGILEPTLEFIPDIVWTESVVLVATTTGGATNSVTFDVTTCSTSHGITMSEASLWMGPIAMSTDPVDY